MLLAVSVYIVVVVGETTRVPFRATLPIPWSMVTLVALAVLHSKVDVLPLVILPGVAENEMMTGLSEVRPSSSSSNGPDETAIVTDLLAVPPELLAVRVYVVVLCGFTTTLPEAGFEPNP